MLDIILEDSRIILIFAKTFFNEGFMKNPKVLRIVNEVYSNYGAFNLGEENLGFSDCLKFVSKNQETVIYEWPLPEQIRHDCHCIGSSFENNCPSCQDTKVIWNVDANFLEIFMATIYIFLFYEIEMKTPDPEENPHQTFTLDLVVGKKGKAVTHGYIYPPLHTFLKECSEKVGKLLREYVKSEMQRMNDYIHGTKDSSIRADIHGGQILLAVSGAGNATYISSNFEERMYMNKARIECHNVDGCMQQFLLIIGLIALNTFYRKQVKND